MKSSEEQLKSRGYIDDQTIENWMHLTVSQLIDLLKSDTASKRTIAATLLFRNHHGTAEQMADRDMAVIKVLTACLVTEKKLYTKIALSEALGTYGAQASDYLIGYLGRVGTNQHQSLPTKRFEKKNYPLPRDLMARTICKIGKPALPSLRACLSSADYDQILEAIDAIGFISYYEQDVSSRDDLIQLFTRFEGDPLLIWKLIRAMQAFNDPQTKDLLCHFTTSPIEQHQWEAIRSLEQIRRRFG